MTSPSDDAFRQALLAVRARPEIAITGAEGDNRRPESPRQKTFRGWLTQFGPDCPACQDDNRPSAHEQPVRRTCDDAERDAAGCSDDRGLRLVLVAVINRPSRSSHQARVPASPVALRPFRLGSALLGCRRSPRGGCLRWSCGRQSPSGRKVTGRNRDSVRTSSNRRFRGRIR